MSYKLSMQEFGEIITLDKKSKKKQNHFTLKDNIFTTCFEELVLSEHISLIKWELETKEDLEVYGNYKSDCICVRLSLNGDYSQYEKNSNTLMKLGKNDISLISIKEIEGKEVYKKNVKNQILDIYLDYEFFNKYLTNSSDYLFNEIRNNHSYKVLKSKKTFHQTTTRVNNIFNSPFKNDLNELFIHGNTLELLSFELNDLISNQAMKDIENKQIKFNDYDMKALELAKEILSNSLENPPTIPELAKLIKLNEFKLKYGFKYFFKTTPYGLLLDKRMQKAHELLKTSDYNINEISSLVGYKQSSNFTKAFFRKYNILPKELMKNRKYYF